MTLPLLVVQHVPWEGPHRILDSFRDVPVLTVNLLADPDDVLPPLSAVRGAVVMGGPMSVNDDLAALSQELSWLSEAMAHELPVLGICLGAQLIAKAAGAEIARGPRPEIGVAPIDTMTAADQLADVLAPSIAAMHWHGEVMTLPNGAVWLARSAQTDVQAFRVGRCAWGLLFHLEVDDVLLEQWLAEPVMVAEAQAALGARYASQLRGDAQQLEPARARKVFDAFAAHCTTRLTA